MRRANLWVVAVLAACPLWAAPSALRPPPPGEGRPPAAAHFDLGREAFRRGRYEETLHEMMMALLEAPGDRRAREYMRLAGEKLIAQDLKRADGNRRALLKDYRETLERARRLAETWKGWVNQAQAAAAGLRWAASYDDAQRVLDDNPWHGDALLAQKRAVQGLSRTLGAGHMLTAKDSLIYLGLFSVATRQLEQARKTLGDAVTLEEAGEIEDPRLQAYLAKLMSPTALVAAAPPPQPAPGGRLSPPARKTPAPVAQPGQWAYAAGMVKFEAALYEEAIELFERALSEAEGHAPARQALLRARIALEDATQRGKAGAERLYSLGLMLYSQGQREGAAEHWRRALALNPAHGYAARALAHAEQELREERK